MLAYHNNPKIRAKYIARVKRHQKADAIVQGYGYWKDGKGCAVGCTLHSSRHSQYPVELGIPEELAHLEDYFFEQLPVKAARQWPLRFLSAAKTGADLSRVYDQWAVWNLTDPKHGVLRLVSDDFPEVQRVVQAVADGAAAGQRVDAGRSLQALGAADAALSAAWAARAAASDAAWAARAAARAAASDAAWAGALSASVARAAAWAAWAAARAAARAAASDAASDAAWAARAAARAAASDAYIKAASDKLIELMEAA
jgi:hypothetical protein